VLPAVTAFISSFEAPAWSGRSGMGMGELDFGNRGWNRSSALNNGAGLIESFNFNPDSVIGGGNVGIQGQ
jgi:hypothetical protein